jgi:PadR family transcriptional regulator, regulatory protein PadR
MRTENGVDGYRERFVRSFLDWVILSILRRKPAYGYEMITAINEEFHVFVSPGSLYPILYNLERSGLVKGQWDNPERRSKKIYELTVQGVRLHRDGLDSIGRILDSFHRPPGGAGL